MGSHGIAAAIVCLFSMAIAICEEPQQPDKKSPPVTKEKLLGKWIGPKGVPVTLEFTEKKVKVTAVAKVDGKLKTTTLEWNYLIDAIENVVCLEPLPFSDDAFLGTAKLKEDGTLSVGIVRLPSDIPNGVKDQPFTKVMAKERKK